MLQYFPIVYNFIISSHSLIFSMIYRLKFKISLQGRFEILSLTGSFTVSDTGGVKCRTGGLSVSLAGPDGRVIGGGLAGILVAASPIQVSPLPFVSIFTSLYFIIYVDHGTQSE